MGMLVNHAANNRIHGLCLYWCVRLGRSELDHTKAILVRRLLVLGAPHREALEEVQETCLHPQSRLR